MQLYDEASALADRLGIEFEGFKLNPKDTRYFIGYWSRIDGQPRPSEPDRQEGWDAADYELKTGVI